MTEKTISVPPLTWVFHHDQLSRAIAAWRQKLLLDGLTPAEADIAINAILGFLDSNEAKSHKMVME